MPRRTPNTDVLATIARRYGIKASGIEALYLTTRKIDALILRANADLQTLHQWTQQQQHIPLSPAPPVPRPSPSVRHTQEPAVAAATSTPVNDPMLKILAEVRAGHKLDAIKLYREATGVGIREAKDAVESLQLNVHPLITDRRSPPRS